MINALIIDDEPNCISSLTTILAQCNPPVKVLGTAGTFDKALELISINDGLFDILFLDIQIMGGNGFSVLKSIPEINFKVIFTTAYDQYAIHAIRFSALDYLLKPIDRGELQEALSRYVSLPDHQNKNIHAFRDRLIEDKTFERLAIPTLTDITFIDLTDIIYLESDNNYTLLYLDNKQRIVSSKNIGYFEDLLMHHGFCRVHNSYIVNVSKVKRLIKGKNGLLELSGGMKIELSGKRKTDLFSMLKI